MKYTAIAAVAFIIFIVGGYFLYPSLVRWDLDNICEAYTSADKRIKDGSLDPAHAMLEIAEVGDKSLTPLAKEMFNSISLAERQQQYGLYQMSAKDAGVDDWECETMKKLLSPKIEPQ